MKARHFDAFALEMKAQWDAEELYVKALEGSAERLVKLLLDTHHQNTVRFAERLCADPHPLDAQS